MDWWMLQLRGVGIVAAMPAGSNRVAGLVSFVDVPRLSRTAQSCLQLHLQCTKCVVAPEV